MKKKPLTILSVVFLLIILILIILRFFFIENFVVFAGSMKETLIHGDYILGWKLVSVGEKKFFNELFHITIKRGDIVILQVPGEQEILIKRIIGLPGETVELTADRIVVNGTDLEETYIKRGVYFEDQAYHIPKGKIFVLGDNRGNSRDSREFGLLERDNVKGKVFLIYFPFQRMRWFF